MGGPIVTHLLFADDILALAKADKKEISECKDLLEKFSRWTGQSINWGKSWVLFSRRTKPTMRKDIQANSRNEKAQD